MREVSDEEFDAMIQRAMSELPAEYMVNLNNVAITYDDEPTPEQLAANNIGAHQLLLGLYEGVPQTARLSSSYSGVLPDKITLFKDSIRAVTTTDEEFFEQIKRTLWHEIAHHYGLNHDRIRTIERQQAQE